MVEATSYHHSDVSDGPITCRPDGGDMAREDRKEVVLQFLREYPLAMPPLLIYRNLRFHEGITFSQDSVRRYLEELTDEGLVRRIQKENLEDRELVDAGEGERSYYIISDKGLETE